MICQPANTNCTAGCRPVPGSTVLREGLPSFRCLRAAAAVIRRASCLCVASCRAIVHAAPGRARSASHPSLSLGSLSLLKEGDTGKNQGFCFFKTFSLMTSGFVRVLLMFYALSYFILCFYWFECFPCILCMCVTCRPGVQGGQKKVLNPLELELYMVVSRRVGAGDEPWLLMCS